MSQPETQLPKNDPVARPKNITVYCLIDDSVLKAKSGKDGPSMAMEIPNRQNKTMI